MVRLMTRIDQPRRARVCMIAYTNYPADTRVRRYAEALVERGDEVDVVCPRVPALAGVRELSGARLHTVRDFDYEGSARPADYARRYAAFVLAAAATTLRLHWRRRYDVIHVHTMPDFLVFSALGPKLLGARVVLDVHDLTPELYASKFDVGEAHRLVRLLTAVERRCVRFAHRAVAVHRPHLEALVRHGNPEEKFTVIVNRPDPALFTPRNGAGPSGPFTLIYHGMVGSRHGIDVAVRAVALARERVPALQLRVIGDGDFFPSVRRLVGELGVEDSVKLEQGLRPIEEIIPLVRGASVGIVPIHDDPFTRYMLPVKLLEYVALGLPVIASATETISAHFDANTICLVPPGDHDALADRIV
jgi:glycosyltransferase involved in cell wall biosynthesis